MSRCEGQLKGICLWFLVEVAALAARPPSPSLLCSLHPKVPLFLGPVPASKVCFHFFKWELPSVQHAVQSPQAKSVKQSQICGTKLYCSWKSKTVNSITTRFHIRSNKRIHSADKSAVIYISSERFEAAFLQASPRFVVSLFIQTNHKAKCRHAAD